MTSHTPILVASHHGASGFPLAMALLRDGGSALDAVEAATRTMEEVWLRKFELDALLMDGEKLAVGAVLALPRCPRPVNVARRILSELPYSMLTAWGAARVAQEMGMNPLEHEYENPPEYDPEGRVVNFIARDSAGRMAVAVAGHSMTAVIAGAGGYVNNRYGAAACSGSGDIALRAGSARSLVLYLKMGLPLWNAARETIADSYEVERSRNEPLHIIALDAEGNHAGFSNERGSTYLFQRGDMAEYERRPRTFVDDEGKAEARPTALPE